jgi:hypothetical protein
MGKIYLGLALWQTQKAIILRFFCYLPFVRSYFFMLLFFAALLMHCRYVNAQAAGEARLRGKVTDAADARGITGVTLLLKPGGKEFRSAEDGTFDFMIPANTKVSIEIQYTGYAPLQKEFFLNPGVTQTWEAGLSLLSRTLGEVRIYDKEERRTNISRIDPKLVQVLPTLGGVESILKTLPGVVSNNEMSSQYSVRGGSFDENLVYVNDIEIYRPFLVRSGQQEGLSFINPDLVSDIRFSAGGFEAKYGDKMSSALDITYRKVKSFSSSVTGSLLGGTFAIEGISPNKKLSWLAGVRQRSNRYILRTLDTQGDYRPLFVDGQLLLTYDVNPRWQLSMLGNYARNRYNFIPETQQSKFGTISVVKQLTVYFDGQELNDFETYLGALSATYKPHSDLQLKFITSAFRSFETERINVQGQYLIYDVESDFGKESFGDTTNLTGVGTSLNHARNLLKATVWNVEHKGRFKQARWGLRFQKEWISDKIKEWTLLDSSGYSLPYSNSEINLQDVLIQKISLNTSRLSGFFQQQWIWGESTEYSLMAGGRFSYWSLNREFIASPRLQFSAHPEWKRDWLFRLSAGYYYQPPFYRELRGFDGVLNSGIRSQQSIHFIAGSDVHFTIGKSPMKFTAEAYYKILDNLIPYKIENVRLRYFANNNSSGYATGIDLRLNGEFARGAESWISVSVMQTAEDIRGDSYTKYYNRKREEIFPGIMNDTVAYTSTFKPGYIPRPTDQRVNVSLFFQDYIPRFPSYKVHMILFYGTGMPFGPNGLNKYADTLRIPPYRRVDIGFSKQLVAEGKTDRFTNWKRHIESAWLSLEVFNLLQIKNTISYRWLRDNFDNQFAIPSYLTARQFNLKLIVKFR